jgi:hypothetical protein
MASKIPEGTCGSAQIEHFTVTEKESALSSFRAAVNGLRFTLVCPGRYARLLVDGEIMMTDTSMEQATNSPFIQVAKGHVLVAGLGLGMVAWPLLSKQPALSSLVVVEKNLDVIRLVEPHLPRDSRLVIAQADIFTWSPRRWEPCWPRFDTVYFDIWPDICKTNTAEADRLRSRAKRWVAPGGWIGDWDTEVRLYDDRKS